MANTTNLNLGKLGGSEKLKTYPTIQAENMDTIDAAFGEGFGINGAHTVSSSLGAVQDGIAIVSNNNTHAAITSGQWVYVKNHGSLSEGLYRATTNIAANGTLSGSNLTADSNGGLNAVYSDLSGSISTLNSNLGSPSSASAVTGADAFSKIATLNSKITNLVKNKTFADTTNSDGNIVVDLSSDNKIILGITTTNKSVMYYFGITSGGNVVVHFNNTAGASYASQSVSGAVWYIETA